MEDKLDYEQLGYDNFLRRGYVDIPEITEDEAQIKTPQIPTSSIRGDIPQEQIEKAINDISKLSQTTSSQYLGLPSGSTVTLTSTINDLTYPDKIMLAICEITAYDGTLGLTSAVIRPNTSWRIDRGYDFHTNSLLAGNGKSLTYFMSMLNQSGVSKNVYWYIRWRFIGTNTAAA